MRWSSFEPTYVHSTSVWVVILCATHAMWYYKTLLITSIVHLVLDVRTYAHETRFELKDWGKYRDIKIIHI